MEAGFRPCKLCHPLLPREETPALYRPLLEEISNGRAPRLRERELRDRGIDPGQLRRWCQKHYGLSFQALARASRLATAFDAIHAGESPTTTALKGTIWISRLETPLGIMVAADFRGQLCLLEFADRRALPTEILNLERRTGATAAPGRTPLHTVVETQLDAYFAGQRQIFDLPLLTPGSDFQQAVWQALQTIPYGQTRSYREQAQHLGKPEAIRAVANANGHNRIAIVIPCHRVIGSDGSLTGYAGGLPRKQALLDLESGRRPGWITCRPTD